MERQSSNARASRQYILSVPIPPIPLPAQIDCYEVQGVLLKRTSHLDRPTRPHSRIYNADDEWLTSVTSICLALQKAPAIHHALTAAHNSGHYSQVVCIDPTSASSLLLIKIHAELTVFGALIGASTPPFCLSHVDQSMPNATPQISGKRSAPDL